MNRISQIGAVALLLVAAGVARAQEMPDPLLPERDVVQRLVSDGFEHVGAAVEDDRLIVTYENRRYRYEMRAMKEVLEVAMDHVDAEQQAVTLVPRHRGIPLVAVTVPVAAYQRFRQGVDAPDAFAGTVVVDMDARVYSEQVDSRRNATYLKLDAVLHPRLVAQFGNFVEPVETQVNVVPELRTSLWRGMRLSGQLIVPVYNELGAEDDYVRPGVLALSQVVRLPASIFTSLTVGYYLPNQYGFQAEAERYLADGRLAVGASVGRTGYASYWRGEWLYDDVNLTTYEARARWHALPSYDLTFEAAYGRYLFRDQAWRGGVTRSFGEVEIGFFGIASDEGSNVGVSMSLPLPGQRYMRPRRVRVRQASSFDWAYRFRREVDVGERLDTGSSLAGMWSELTPAFIPRRLARELQ